MERRLRLAPPLRVVAACSLLAMWLVLLLLGSPMRAAVHLFLAAALAVFPWRLLGDAATSERAEPMPSDDPQRPPEG